MTKKTIGGITVFVAIAIIFIIYMMNREDREVNRGVISTNIEKNEENEENEQTISNSSDTNVHQEDSNTKEINEEDEKEQQEKEQETTIQKGDVSEEKEMEKEAVSKDGFSYGPIPESVQKRMVGVSWEPESPVSLEDLNYITVLYWGFDEEEHQGELIIHKKLAEEVMNIFHDLYDGKFPIEKMNLIDDYGASDDLSMADNNTSAFCFRPITGQTGNLSNHSYGIAIDINPLQNPYIKGSIVLPPEGKAYVDRTQEQLGMIAKDGLAYKAFIDRGWTWGGDWTSPIDYQHFEKNIDIE